MTAVSVPSPSPAVPNPMVGIITPLFSMTYTRCNIWQGSGVRGGILKHG